MNASSHATSIAARDFKTSLFAMLGITIALMLSALDQTVIGNILPRVVADMNGFELYSWAATGYMLTSMITIPIFGRMGDIFGRKPFVLLSIVIFSLASLWCGAADSMLSLVLARALQGLGGGMLIGAGQACVPELFPDTRQRLRWQILLNLVFTVANAVGPVAGGWLTQNYGWRYVFYVNIPLGSLALFMVWRYLPRFLPARTGRAAIDWCGAVMISFVLITLQLAVENLSDFSWQGVALLVSCAAGMLVLIRVEKAAKEPFLPQALFRQRDLRLLFILATVAGAIMFAVLFYAPLLFQGGYGYAPAAAGVLMLPFAVSSSLASIASSQLLTRMRRPQWLPRIGFAILTMAIAVLALSNAESSRAVLMTCTMAAGLGLGFVLLNLTIFTQSAASREILGIASALQKSLRLVGGLLGTAILGGAVNALYKANVDRLFDAAGHSAQAAQFYNPRFLMDSSLLAGSVAPEISALARMALEQAVALGLASVCVLGALSIWIMFRLPHIDLLGSKQGQSVAHTATASKPLKGSSRNAG